MGMVEYGLQYERGGGLIGWNLKAFGLVVLF